MNHETPEDLGKGPQFYDRNLRNVSKPLESSPWLRLYETAADLMDQWDRATSIVDLGCGTGRFAKLIASRGFTNYWGVDFSAARIEEARRYNPELDFEVASIFDEVCRDRVQHAGACVLLEVLEHIHRDTDVFEMIRSGTSVVLSVPNFDSAVHVRWFDDAAAVWDRYGRFIEPGSERWRQVINERRPHKRTFVLGGRRA